LILCRDSSTRPNLAAIISRDGQFPSEGGIMQALHFLRALKTIAGLTCLLFALTLWTSTALAVPSNPVPHIDSLSPLSAAPGGAQFTLTVNGTGFVAGSVVSWSGTGLATTFVSAQRLTAIVPAGTIATSGTGWITVFSPGPQGGTSNLAFVPVGNNVAHVNFATFSLTAGSSPVGVAQADFNGDGKLDLVMANYGSNTLSMFLGNGDGTFQAPATITLPNGTGGPVGLAAGDFNGDGLSDLVVGYDSSFGISVLLGNGDGTFVPSQDFSAGTFTYQMVLGDFNEDGALDVAVTNYGRGAVQILLGDGNGNLQPAVAYSVNANSFFIQEADLNGDGHLDLVVGNFGGSGFSVLLGNGDGTFRTQQTYNAGSQAADVAIGDFDGDGIADIVATDQGSTSMNFLRGNGDGTFGTAQPIPVGFSTRVVAAGDFNADGKLDLTIVKNSGGGGIGVLLGNGDGTFQAAQSFPGASFTYGILVGNYNTGGGLGIATTDFATNKLDVLLETVSISPASISFGNQALGVASSARDFTITNSTSQLVTFSGISFTGANSADFSETDNCGSTLASGALCTVHATFTPGAAGARTASISVADNAPASPQTSTVTGTGMAAPVATLSAAGISFPNETIGASSPAQSVTVTNTGTAALNIASITAGGTNAGDFTSSNDCGTALAPSAMCTVNATFTPSAAGARSGTVTLTDDASDSPQTISLSGQGLLAPTATLSASSITFALRAVGSTSAAQSVTLTNNGNSALTITGITAVGANATDFAVTNNCGVSLAAGSTCSVSATITPAASGIRTASIRIADGAADSPQSVILSGQGQLLAPAVTISASSLAFGQRVVGSATTAQTVTLTNSGNAALTIASITAAGANAADFAVTNNCGASLATAAICSINATFTPAASGTRSATIAITDGASGSPQSIALSGTGQDFSLSLASSTATVTAGNTANLQLTVTPLAGFTQPITLACTGAPALATCTVSPSSVTPSGAAINVTVTLGTTGEMIAPARVKPPAVLLGVVRVPILILAIFCVFGSWIGSRRWQSGGIRYDSQALLFGLLLIVSLGLVACGGGSSAVATNPKTPAGSYTLTITATAGALTRNTTVTLTVQ
jgi:FG-GAP-like repeat